VDLSQHLELQQLQREFQQVQQHQDQPLPQEQLKLEMLINQGHRTVKQLLLWQQNKQHRINFRSLQLLQLKVLILWALIKQLWEPHQVLFMAPRQLGHLRTTQ